jgi:hypothetical protein
LHKKSGHFQELLPILRPVIQFMRRDIKPVVSGLLRLNKRACFETMRAAIGPEKVEVGRGWTAGNGIEPEFITTGKFRLPPSSG